MQILRNLGMGKKSTEEHLLEEVGFLLEELRKTKGQNSRMQFIPSSCNYPT